MRNGKKKYLFYFGIAALSFCLIYTALFAGIRQEFIKRSNAEISALIGSILSAYPEVPEEEIIAALKNNDSVSGREFTNKYGFAPGDFLSSGAKAFSLQEYILSFFIGAGLIAAFAVGFFIMKKREEREIRELTAYLKRIERGDYALHLTDNSEEELSRLSNEIYKLTVLFRENARDSLKKSENLSRSLADISHQIRTPLTSVSILLDNITDDPEMDDGTRQDFLREIRRQLNLIEELVTSLLKLSKFDSGTVKLNPVPLTAEKLLSDATENLSVLSDLKNIAITAEGDLDVSFLADRRWQTEAVSNILKNCIEHSPENSKITVTAENTGIYLRIKMQDEGEGIGKEDLSRIFERFYKAKNAGKDSIGVGLSLAKTVIEADGGYIKVSSEEGKGTTFTVGYKRA